MPKDPRRIVPIPSSAASPFAPGRPELTYFIERTSGGAVTTLAPTLASAHDHCEVFEMGYTNLWIHRRVALLMPNHRPVTFKRDDTRPVRPNDRVGRYFIVAAAGPQESWYHADEPGAKPGQMVLGFAHEGLALARLEGKPIEVPTLVTQLMDDVYWH